MPRLVTRTFSDPGESVADGRHGFRAQGSILRRPLAARRGSEQTVELRCPQVADLKAQNQSFESDDESEMEESGQEMDAVEIPQLEPSQCPGDRLADLAAQVENLKQQKTQMMTAYLRELDSLRDKTRRCNELRAKGTEAIESNSSSADTIQQAYRQLQEEFQVQYFDPAMFVNDTVRELATCLALSTFKSLCDNVDPGGGNAVAFAAAWNEKRLRSYQTMNAELRQQLAAAQAQLQNARLGRGKSGLELKVANLERQLRESNDEKVGLESRAAQDAESLAIALSQKHALQLETHDLKAVVHSLTSKVSTAQQKYPQLAATLAPSVQEEVHICKEAGVNTEDVPTPDEPEAVNDMPAQMEILRLRKLLALQTGNEFELLDTECLLMEADGGACLAADRSSPNVFGGFCGVSVSVMACPPLADAVAQTSDGSGMDPEMNHAAAEFLSDHSGPAPSAYSLVDPSNLKLASISQEPSGSIEDARAIKSEARIDELAAELGQKQQECAVLQREVAALAAKQQASATSCKSRETAALRGALQTMRDEADEVTAQLDSADVGAVARAHSLLAGNTVFMRLFRDANRRTRNERRQADAAVAAKDSPRRRGSSDAAPASQPFLIISHSNPSVVPSSHPVLEMGNDMPMVTRVVDSSTSFRRRRGSVPTVPAGNAASSGLVPVQRRSALLTSGTGIARESVGEIYGHNLGIQTETGKPAAALLSARAGNRAGNLAINSDSAGPRGPGPLSARGRGQVHRGHARLGPSQPSAGLGIVSPPIDH
mmetsp:Transcript_33970/g.72078  ORF Transcript_33970/g.72078 Transcript_33970/m.72078 type:complete len:773 (+) Transcript_33970:25-2343(+)|eukprot:CAMPEP_0204317746 /NCGR_PEP_ID=MMETSP0469-20131031/6142_1 /ASSEMBLY_ACC=CAM_ASM_000384 /TAXON_ID=2969 /ORGANISM="Oxyrrhis marina" /LENGTH=772 /DNA_ID=CAMNT_0051298705 /DNA_START=9 /DNA_END=2327 /DNA_ORIENTATION=-